MLCHNSSLLVGAIDGVLDNIFTFIHAQFSNIVIRCVKFSFSKSNLPLQILFRSNLYSYYNLVILNQIKSNSICRIASECGNLQGLQWARANSFNWNALTCSAAAEGGYLEVLQWARNQGCCWNAYTCSSAARGGHLEVLKWARANGCDWNAGTCSAAAGGGHMEVLQWARANGCDWNQWTGVAAADGGHFKILQWAHANNAVCNAYTCAAAAGRGHLEVLQWARAQVNLKQGSVMTITIKIHQLLHYDHRYRQTHLHHLLHLLHLLHLIHLLPQLQPSVNWFHLLLYAFPKVFGSLMIWLLMF
jgi:hypothetical protein